MDWSFYTIWFDQIPPQYQITLDWKNQKEAKQNDFSNIQYLTIGHHKSKEKNLLNLPECENLKYLELNWSNAVSLQGIEKYKSLKRLVLHYCVKLESLIGLSSITESIENLQVDRSKKLSNIKDVASIKKLRVLRLNDCGEFDNLIFLSKLPNLLDFRFVNTNVLDGNLNPIIQQSSICSVGFFNKRHYNLKNVEVDSLLKQRFQQLNLQKVVEGNRSNFAWPTNS